MISITKFCKILIFEKVLDKLKNDDSDSGEILKPDIDDIPPVKEKTKEKTSGRGAVQVL